MPDDMNPVDPITENMNALQNKPIKAFSYQDHQAHIQIHMAAMQDPKIKQVVGQNPQAPLIMQALQAHITEHVGMEYRRQMEQMMGITLPEVSDDSEKMSKDMELQISRMAVPAAQQLLGQNQTAIAAQQAQQAAQDPVIQMQLQELQLKKQEISIKERKMVTDAAAEADKLELEKQRIAAQKEIAAMQTGAKVKTDKETLLAKQQLEGMKIGAQIGQQKAQMEAQKSNQNQQKPKGKE